MTKVQRLTGDNRKERKRGLVLGGHRGQMELVIVEDGTGCYVHKESTSSVDSCHKFPLRRPLHAFSAAGPRAAGARSHDLRRTTSSRRLIMRQQP